MASAPTPSAQLGDFEACQSQADIATALGTTTNKLLFHLYSKKAPTYRLFAIPKASGGKRLIEVPPPVVKAWQYKLLWHLIEKYKVKPAVHGFVHGRGIRSNARRHVGRRVLLNIDLLEFFPSIHFGRVQGLFQSHPFNCPKVVASTLAQLCTREGRLPQGAPTSPIISNFICRRMDNDLWSLSMKLGCRYTRYADDITISTDQKAFPIQIVSGSDAAYNASELGHELKKVIERNKFTINPHKTRLQPARRRQEVTGLIVNRRVNLERRYVRRLRAILNDWRVYGETAATARFVVLDAKRVTRRGSTPGLREHVFGKLSFLETIRGKGDPVHARYALEFGKLCVSTHPLIVRGRSAEIIAFLREALWVVIAYDGQNAIVWSATAFALRGTGIVTAAHVFTESNGGISRWSLVRGSAPFDEIPISAYTYDPGVDVAVVTTKAQSRAVLQRSDQPYVNGGDVALVGFPNWHSSGDQPVRVAVKTVQEKPISGVTHVGCAGYAILSGASGGPVLTGSGGVCGVIVNSHGHSTMPDSFIASKHIDAAVNGKTVTV